MQRQHDEYTLIKRIFNVEVEILVRKKMKLKEQHLYLSYKNVSERNLK